MAKRDRGLVRLTGLWKGHTEEGEDILTGDISPSSRLLILANRQKVRASDPDFVAYIAPPQERQDRAKAWQESLWEMREEESEYA